MVLAIQPRRRAAPGFFTWITHLALPRDIASGRMYTVHIRLPVTLAARRILS
jgi:hypothetical protein